MPIFWTNEALIACQTSALHSTAIWTSALKDLPDIPKAMIWEKTNPRLQVAKRTAKQADFDLDFAILDEEFTTEVMGTPNYSRIRYNKLQNRSLYFPVGRKGVRIGGNRGWKTRAINEANFVVLNYQRIFEELKDGILVQEGVIDLQRLTEVFETVQNIKQEGYFIFRNLELEI